MCVVYRVVNSLANLTIFGTVPSSILDLPGSGSVGVCGDSFLRNSDAHNREVFLGRLCVYVSAVGSRSAGMMLG